MIKQCKNCKWWEELNTVKREKKMYGYRKFSYGNCRRYPPKENYEVNAPAIGKEFIQTEFDDWCGEFKQK